jgi:hypothetical protein
MIHAALYAGRTIPASWWRRLGNGRFEVAQSEGGLVLVDGPRASAARSFLPDRRRLIWP